VIKIERPPNFEQILKAFPNAANDGVIFAYGEDIYNPSGGSISSTLLAHEGVHCERQCMSTYGTDPVRWWEKYIADAEFRYREELLAHVAEFKAQANYLTDRNGRARLLMSTAQRLTAPLYNYSDKHSLSAAMRDLRWELER
jgi:hypothetical protein